MHFYKIFKIVAFRLLDLRLGAVLSLPNLPGCWSELSGLSFLVAVLSLLLLVWSSQW